MAIKRRTLFGAFVALGILPPAAMRAQITEGTRCSGSKPCPECQRCNKNHRCKPVTNGTACSTGTCVDGVCTSGGGGGNGYLWNPPAQSSNPTVIDLSADGDFTRNLGSTEDALLLGPTSGTRKGRIVINGGRNIILRGRGGYFSVPDDTPTPPSLSWVTSNTSLHWQFRLFTFNTFNTLLFEDVSVKNANNRHFDVLVGGGPSGDYYSHNVRFDNILGQQDGWHADAIQFYNDIDSVNLENHTAKGNYQPGFYSDASYSVGALNISKSNWVHVAGAQSSPFWLTDSGGCIPLDIRESYTKLDSGRPLVGQNLCTMPGMSIGTPPNGDYATV